MDERLTTEEAAAVFRRAAELEVSAPDGLDIVALEQIGSEAGLSSAAIRQAIAELKSGGLATRPQAGYVIVERWVDGPASELRGEVERFLKRQLFRIKRRFGDRVVWERRPGMLADLSRGLDFNKRLHLNHVREVTATAVEEPGGSKTHIRFELDLRSSRRGWRALAIGSGAVGVGASTAVAVGLIGLDPAALFVLPPGAMLVGGGYAASQAGFRRSCERAATACERFLDELDYRV